MRGITAITEKVKAQIEQVRRGGKSNMFDINAVPRIANDEKFYELVVFIEENHTAYSKYILTGNVKIIEWDSAAFTVAFGDENLRNGQHIADVARSLGHTMNKITETSATIEMLLNGQSINITIEIPCNSKGVD
jgi:hypothetical protein